MGDPDRIRELVSGAGFDEPGVDEIAFDFRYADFADVWDTIIRLAGPLAEKIEGLADDERNATRTAIMENMASYRNEDGSYTAPAMSWGVVAG
jgi:anaerobic selenocysteine-containing dehydrogenase